MATIKGTWEGYANRQAQGRAAANDSQFLPLLKTLEQKVRTLEAEAASLRNDVAMLKRRVMGPASCREFPPRFKRGG